jgi:hypothetical protein
MEHTDQLVWRQAVTRAVHALLGRTWVALMRFLGSLPWGAPMTGIAS